MTCTGIPSNPPKGRYSTVAVAAFGNVLLITGGYRGNVLGDLLAYTVPKSVARNKVILEHLISTYIKHLASSCK